MSASTQPEVQAVPSRCPWPLLGSHSAKPTSGSSNRFCPFFFVFLAAGRAAVWHGCGHKCSISGLCFCKAWGVWPHNKSSLPELLMLFFPCECFHEADEAEGGPGDLGQKGFCQEETTVRPHCRYPFLSPSSLPLGAHFGCSGKAETISHQVGSGESSSWLSVLPLSNNCGLPDSFQEL